MLDRKAANVGVVVTQAHAAYVKDELENGCRADTSHAARRADAATFHKSHEHDDLLVSGETVQMLKCSYIMATRKHKRSYKMHAFGRDVCMMVVWQADRPRMMQTSAANHYGSG